MATRSANARHTAENGKKGREKMQAMKEKKKERLPETVSAGDIDIDTGEKMTCTGEEDDIDVRKKYRLELVKEDGTPMSYDERLSGFYKLMESQSVWGANRLLKNSVQAAMSMLRTKTGMYGKIPIYCKGENCPYSESCGLVTYGIYPKGQACPIEIAFIERQWAKYSDEFDLSADDATDEALVIEIIRMEVYMERCTALMSKELSPVQLEIVGMTEDGSPIQSPSVSKAVEAYERFSRIRNKNYELMLATRKDKSKNGGGKTEKSIMDIMAEAEQMDDFYKIEQRPDYIEGVDDK